MNRETHRYFIELEPKENAVVTEPMTRARETEIRRQQAAEFVESFNEWLRNEALETKVASLAITALGQVQITCEADVIHHMRDREELPIATIRQGAVYADHLGRFALAH
ncbi:MAG: hypothetical protein JO126_02725 [Alphaproteobacteria bacterium]|nr:hypothetical protein [Alphaproteobacteria bacterium]